VALHYSAKSSESVVFYLLTDGTVTKSEIAPGQSNFTPTAMNPDSDMLVMLSFPSGSGGGLEITEPFSRVDVYFGPGVRIERTEIRHGFFARFTNPDFHDDWWN